MSESDRLLNELAEIHDEWVAEMESKVQFTPEHSNPHNKETGESDYNIHYVDRSASPEQEQVFQDRIAPILKRLEELRLDGDPSVDDGLDEKLSKVSDTVDFHLAVNGDAVQMLVKHDFDSGVLSYRQAGEWIPVTPEDDLPVLDEADLVEVVGDATGIWDEKEGGELSLSDFKSVLLDGI